MKIDIQQFTDSQVLVNDKLVVRDSENTWIEKIELTQREREAFFKHINKTANE